jgi:alpha-ketoglutarate-dependent taurine dioxygenase
MPAIYLPEPGCPHVLVEASGAQTLRDLDPALIEAHYRQYGALLLRGFGADVAQFQGFARTFCSTAVVNESPGRAAIDPANNIFGVNGGTQAFALHPELSREPWKPDLAMFCCLSPPSQGGQTTLCDGIALVRALPSGLREALAPRRLVYVNRTSPQQLQYWLGSAEPDDALLRAPPSTSPYRFERLRDGQIIRHFSRPLLHKPMFADGPAFGNFLLFARFTVGRDDFPLLDDWSRVPEPWFQAIHAAGEAVQCALTWAAGDVLMLDNTRFMHGRTAILDAAERQIATFFGYLRFAVPDAEEPADPVWRREDFTPPLPPALQVA